LIPDDKLKITRYEKILFSCVEMLAEEEGIR
jgi:hypothetical protein